jgi:hypothetical protein
MTGQVLAAMSFSRSARIAAISRPISWRLAMP